MQMQYQICLDSIAYKSKPSSKTDVITNSGYVTSQIAQLSARITNKTVSIGQHELELAIAQGKTFTLGQFGVCPTAKRPRRVIDLLEVLSIITVDFDNGKHELREIIDSGLFGTVYTTFSSTALEPKYRAIGYLREPIYNTESAIRLCKAAYAQFPHADAICADVTRLNFGGREILHSDSTKIEPETVMDLVSSQPQVKWKSGKVPDIDFPDLTDAQQQRLIKSVPPRARNYTVAALHGIVNEVVQYDHKMKSRYQTVWYAAMQIGKLTIIAPNIARKLITAAIEQNPVFADWDKDPEWVIDMGYAYGRKVIDAELMEDLGIDLQND
jgi:hypothetical protein